MKKITAVLFLIMLVGCLSFSGNNVFYAHAVENTQPYYLIEADYEDSADKYGILADEIKQISRPFDFELKQMMVGQSISPVVNDFTQSFEKTININSVEISQLQSLYFYVYFSEELANNLEVKLTDGSNYICWQISSTELCEQIVQKADSKLRYGWQKLEQPMQAGNMVGNLSTATQMIIKYSAENANAQSKYARLSLYAPYISSSTNSHIAFSEKQNFYNFSVNFGSNFNKLCVDDEFIVTDWKALFDYCIIGDIDCLKFNTNLYKFILEIIDVRYNVIKATMFGGDFKTKLSTEGTYTFRVSIYDKNDKWLWKNPDQTTEVKKFVALYLANGIPTLKAGQSTSVDIVKNNLITYSNNLSVQCSDNSVADVSVVDNKLYINAKQTGKATIKLKINAVRANAEEQVYEYTYTLKVKLNFANSWTKLLFSGIGLLIAGVIVYIIMVKRRLIPGKYPKY